MGIFALLAALLETIGDTMKEKSQEAQEQKERERLENIDFYNIESVSLDYTEPAYRTETAEEFDPVMSDFLTRQDGWQHYETETVEYEVLDGENYCFTITYKDGSKIYRKFHESSPITQRLLNFKNKAPGKVEIEYANGTKKVFEFDDEPKVSTPPEPIEKDVQENPFLETVRSNLTVDYSVFRHYGVTFKCNLVSHYDSLQLNFEMSGTKGLAAKIDKDGDLEIKANIYDAKGNLLYIGEEYIEYRELRRGYAANYFYFSSDYIQGAHSMKVYAIDPTEEYDDWDEDDTDEEFEEEPKAPKVPLQKKERFAVIDFETTGLNYDFRRPPMDEILSVAIIDQDGNTLLNTLCDTVHIKSWYEAQCINGISPQMVKGYPTFVELLPKVIEILSSYDYVIAYNVPFEKSFLENYARCYTPTDFSIHKVHWGQDPMEMFMNHMNSRRFLKLEAAAHHFGYKYHAHNALEDTKATLFVYNALRKK